MFLGRILVTVVVLKLALSATVVFFNSDTEVLTCVFDSSKIVAHVGSWQEPNDRFLTSDDWNRVGKCKSGDHDQKVRVASLTKIYKVVPAFMKKMFPRMNWWLDGGSLVGASRGGVIVPWDTDGDMVPDNSFNTENTWKILLENMPNRTKIHGRQCPEGGCHLFTLPAEIDPSSTVALAMHSLPTELAYPGRFVDLETGYLLEFSAQDDPAHRAGPLGQTNHCSFGGTPMNVPKHPMEFMASSGTINLGHDELKDLIEYPYHRDGLDCKVQMCEDPVEHIQEAKVDPFKQVFFRPEKQAGKAWTVANASLTWQTCSDASKLDEAVYVKPTCL